MRSRMIPACSLAVAAVLFSSTGARARTAEDCQLAWGQAARSYTAGKQGPQDGDFKSACEMDQKGEKENARVEAVMVASASLARINAETCERFLKNYVGVGEPGGVCAAATAGDDAAFRKAVTESLPAPSKGAAKGKKK